MCELWGYDEEALRRHLEGLRDGHMWIYHGRGYLDLDCGCGYGLPQSRLACLRLEDLAEFYT